MTQIFTNLCVEKTHMEALLFISLIKQTFKLLVNISEEKKITITLLFFS